MKSKTSRVFKFFLNPSKIFLILACVLINLEAKSQACATAWSANNGTAGWWAAGSYDVGSTCSFGGRNYTCGSASTCDTWDPSIGGSNWTDAGACVACSVPTLNATDAATSILATSAQSGGNVTAAGTGNITSRGICWNTAGSPTTASSNTTTAGTTGAFGPLNMTGLTPETKYYVRAFATNDGCGTGYGAETWFYTGAVPTLTTVAAMDIHCESFTSGGENITFGRDKRSCCGTDALGSLLTEATEFGVIYGTVLADVTNSTPSSLVGASVKSVHIANNASSLNQTPRNQEMTGLTASTTYYYKAYATNTQGTGYGAVSNFNTTAACPVLYSCPWNAAVANRWSFNSNCSTADGASLTSNTICYHRHDWLSAAITNLDADVATQSGTRAMTELPYRLVMQSGSRVVVNNPVFVGGFQLEVQSNAQYSNNGALTFNVDNTAGAQGHIARLSNSGSILVRGSYANNIALTGTGEYCKTGNFVNTLTSPGSLNGDYAANPSFPDTRYTNGACVGTSTLPVELISFEGFKQQDYAIINWTTASEINNDFFELYTSVDGINWKKISTIQGAGNSTEILNYASFDYDVNGYSIKYYKLKQVDFDGGYEYSKIISINFEGENNLDLIVFDNLENIVANINLEGNVYLTAHNIEGKAVFNSSFYNTKHSVVFIDKTNFSPGFYLISINNGDNVASKKLWVK